MALVPGSGAVIRPIFNEETLGVDSVVVEKGGSGYSEINPPKLRIGNCGNPVRDAVLKPVITNGRITGVIVLDSGEGYDPLRVNLIPRVPEEATEVPVPAKAQPILKDDGSLEYIKVTQPGDNHFYDVDVEILGGEGSGAEARAVSKSVTGLVLLNPGRNYETAPFISISGGNGRGATGVADIDNRGIVSPNIEVSNPGQFYLKAPYVLLVGGGGRGAKAKAVVDQGEIVDIELIDPGSNYTSPPKVVFARNVKVKRKSRNRQSYNPEIYNISGITKNIGRADSNIYLSTTAPFPGSGVILLQKELIRYTGKDSNRLTGCTRGLNFRYDQRIVLDDLQDDESGVTSYEFNVGDRIVRLTESADNKIAVVYDWNPSTKELFVVFKVDELAFIDAGAPGEKTNVVFDAGVSDTTDSGDLPHILVDDEFGVVYKLTTPLSTLTGFSFQDTEEFDGLGNGLPDLFNDSTGFEDQINLDGGVPSTLYGIEETQGGQNTTLFVVGDKIKDSSLPFKIAQIQDAGALDEGVDHLATLTLQMDTSNPDYYNSVDYTVGEVVTGTNSQVQATVKSWDPINKILVLEDVVPYDTGSIEDGIIYEFSQNSTVIEVRINSVGYNYTSVPTVTISDTGTFQATATATITADQVTSIAVTNGGYGYSTKPTVTITNGGGQDAIAEAILGGEKLQGQNGALWKIKTLNYDVQVRNDNF